LVEFPSQVTSEIGITMLANSITLTPGTITVVAKKDKFIVHALTPDFAKRLYGSQFEKKIMEIEKFL
jgi:multicomponent Na+:H+ antiporter subunit E